MFIYTNCLWSWLWAAQTKARLYLLSSSFKYLYTVTRPLWPPSGRVGPALPASPHRRGSPVPSALRRPCLGFSRVHPYLSGSGGPDPDTEPRSREPRARAGEPPTNAPYSTPHSTAARGRWSEEGRGREHAQCARGAEWAPPCLPPPGSGERPLRGACGGRRRRAQRFTSAGGKRRRSAVLVVLFLSFSP